MRVALVTLALFVSASAQSRLDRAIAEARKVLADDPTRAIEVLERADRMVRNAQARELLVSAYTRRGKQQYDRKKYHGAYRDFSAANRLKPDSERILQSLGVVSMQRRRPRDAERFMKRVLDLNPDNREALITLGELARRRDDTAAASEYLERAAKVAPDRADVAKLANKYGKEAEVEARFVTVARGNFRLQFGRGDSSGVEDAVDTILSELERAHRELRTRFAARPGSRITVVIYSADQFERVRSTHAWAGAYYDGKLRIALHGWPAGRTQLRRDLRHELTHAFIHELYPKTPVWLHEGLAQIVEDRSVTAATDTVKSHGLLPRTVFLDGFAQSNNQSTVSRGYAQSLMLVGHLERIGGRRSLRRLLRELALGTDTDAALKSIYRKTLDELLAETIR